MNSNENTYLCDFDKWDITEIVDVLGRSCTLITGDNNRGTFTASVDLHTGIMLRFEQLDVRDKNIGYVEVSKISVDENVSVKRFYKEGFTLI